MLHAYCTITRKSSQPVRQRLLFYYRGTKKCVLYKPPKSMYTSLQAGGRIRPKQKSQKQQKSTQWTRTHAKKYRLQRARSAFAISVKLYRYLYQTPLELEAVVKEYIHFFNEERPHRKLDLKTSLQFETESENM